MFFPGTEMNTKDTTKNRKELEKSTSGKILKKPQMELQIPEHNARENCFLGWFFFVWVCFFFVGGFWFGFSVCLFGVFIGGLAFCFVLKSITS